MIFKNMMFGAVAIVSVVSFSTTAIAAPSWDTCAIQRMGVSGASTQSIKITSCGISSNNGKWLSITQQENASLATLLTALSLGKKVKINADYALGTTSGSAFGPINTIYLDQ